MSSYFEEKDNLIDIRLINMRAFVFLYDKKETKKCDV